MGAVEDISRFVRGVGDSINVTFNAIDTFLDIILTFFVSMGFWISVLVFFIIFFGIISLPLMLFKYWDDVRSKYKSVTNKLIDSISS